MVNSLQTHEGTLQAARIALAVLLLILTASHRADGAEGVIDTYAGTGGNGFSGDGGPATKALLSELDGMAVGTEGNLFIAGRDHRVRKVDANGVITTLAGNGSPGFSGDGGPAADAQLHYPSAVAVDSDGNVFIADLANHRVRKVDASGIITTVAGTGAAGFAGDGGPATDAELNEPRGLAIDSFGNLFVSDTRFVRKVDSDGVISTVAGGGSTLGDGGLATNAALIPYGLDVDALGNLFIADHEQQGIRKVDITGIITTVAGSGIRGFSGDGGPATDAALDLPNDVLVDADGNLFIADRENLRVRRVDANGIITTVVGRGSYGSSGDGGLAAEAEISWPNAIDVDTSGNLFVAEQAQRVRIVGTDRDDDGLPDRREEIEGTDPDNPDTDADGLSDWEETQLGTDPLAPDSDGDGLTDREEFQTYGTDPLRRDTDGDGLSDGDEIHSYQTDPRRADTDGDGLSDGKEVNEHHTNPLDADTDGDALSDGYEVVWSNTDPNNADTDGDLFDDGIEVNGGTCAGVAFNGGSDPNNPLSTPIFFGSSLNPGLFPRLTPPLCGTAGIIGE